LSVTYIGIGSNLNPVENIKKLQVLLSRHDHNCRFSTFYKSEAVGVDAPSFINGVVELTTSDNLVDFARRVKAWEQELGREPGRKQVSHSIDLDILMFDDVVSTTKPVLPRTDIFEYAFVLKPLGELCAQKVIPGDNKTIAELVSTSLDKLPDAKMLTPIEATTWL
jgi:2-amino-4-hydroxy-6-hydroxymethyldihydropteridine diphosphokinase